MGFGRGSLVIDYLVDFAAKGKELTGLQKYDTNSHMNDPVRNSCLK